MSTQSEKRSFSKMQLGVFIIAILSLVVAFTGINFQSISTYFSERMFPKPDYTVESWTTPSFFLTTDFLQTLSISPEYFVVTSVSFKSDRPYYGEPMQFSISFENRGKKSVEQPRVVIFFVDYVYRVWNVWNESSTDDILMKECSFEYYFPPLDQKALGTWSLLVLLFDDAHGVLVSYVLRAFTVTDIPPRPWWQDFLVILGIIGGSFALGFVIKLLRRLWKTLRLRKPKVKKRKTTEKKED